MPLNDSNFLIWFGPNESPTAVSLPRPFVHEPDVLSPVVWLVPGDQVRFYINTVNNTAVNGPIKIEHERDGLLNVATQSLNTVFFPTGAHTYGSFTVPNLVEGFVRLAMGTNRSQWLWLTTADRAADRTAVVKFTNGERRLQNIRYGYLPAGWQQQFRIRLSVKSENSAHNKEVYTESTTGKRRHYYSEPGWVIGFSTPEYDRWGHRAMAALLEHDTILINDKPYTFETGYKANLGESDALSTGEFELRDEIYSTLHRA